MNSLVRKFAVAAALATLAPALASACEPEPPRTAVVHVGGTIVHSSWREREAWRMREREREVWRERERTDVRREYARLDEARADFYSVPHRPWRVRQFEAWYAHERAELDARWQRVAWR